MTTEKETFTSSTSSKNDDLTSSASEVQSDPYQKKSTNPTKKSWLKRFKFKNLFEKVEERPTPPEVYNWRIYSTALMASAAAIIIGYDGGFIGGTVALDSFKKEFGLDNSSHSSFIVSNVISVFHAGCFFGALFSYPFSYYCGRRIPLLFASVLITIGSAIMLAASSKNGLGPLYAGRVLAGIAVGFSTNLTVVYISEVAPPAIRGQLTSSYEIGWRIGDLVGFWINYGVDSHIAESRKQWLIPFAIQMIPSGMFLLGSIFMKESPRWLFQVGKYDQAIKNLTWFRQLPEDHEYIIYEVNQVKESIEIQKNRIGLGIWDPFMEVFFRNKKILWRLFITCFMFILQNFLGIQSINYYSPIIFKGLGVKGTNATLFSTGMFGVVKFFCTFIYIIFIVDTVGRRKAFMSSSTVCAICFWYIGAYLKINDPTVPGHVAGPGGRAAIGLMYIWIASFILAWSGGPFVLGTEVFDQNIRSFVQAINAAVSWVPIFVMSRYTNNMINTMHYGIYFFFASLAVLSIPFVFFFVPETRGIALEDMDMLFDRSISAHNAHRVVLSKIRNDPEREHHNVDLFKADTNKSNHLDHVDTSLFEKNKDTV